MISDEQRDVAQHVEPRKAPIVDFMKPDKTQSKTIIVYSNEIIPDVPTNQMTGYKYIW